MDPVSSGLCGVVVVLCGVITKMALEIRSLNSDKNDAQKDRVKQAEDCSKEKDDIYKEWRKSDEIIRTDHKNEFKDILDKDQALILQVSGTLNDLIRERAHG